MKKRILALMLALCMIFCLSACGKKAENPQTPVNTPETTPGTNTGDQTPAGNDGKKEDVSIKGTKKDNVYENEYLNLKITLPGGWVFYSDEQIAQANNMTVEMFSETDVADAVKAAGQYMDLMMADVYGSNLNLIIQPMDPSVKFYSDEQIFTLSENAIREQFVSAGITLETYEPLKMQIGGEERTVLHMVLNAGYTLDDYQIWLRPDGGEYMGVLTVAMVGGGDPQTVISNISFTK